MKLLCWNCRGIGRIPTVRELEGLLLAHSPSVVFLSETKCKTRRVEFLKNKFNLQGISVDSVHTGGGLALLWKREVYVSLRSYSKNHVDVLVTSESDCSCWRFTGVYGIPDSANKAVTWKLLRHLSRGADYPWLCGGDFNEILYNSDKEGGVPRQPGQISAFRSCLTDCGLMDLGFEGYKFTWCNGHQDSGTVRERIDLAVANTAWRLKFPGAKVKHLESIHSDHMPILVDLSASGSPKLSYRKRFRFEAMWIRHEDCEKIIEEEWNRDSNSETYDIPWEKMKNCSVGLLNWSKFTFGNIKRTRERIEKRITELRRGTISNKSKHEEGRLMDQLADLDAKEEIKWKQRAKFEWLKEGDRNTSFFHAKANTRFRNNSISRLKDSRGEWCESATGIQDIIIDYFGSLFTSSKPKITDIDTALNCLTPKITPEMNSRLQEPYSMNEVTRALSQMFPLKSPGPDGMPPIFFQKFWHIVHKEVTACVLSFLNDHKSSEQLHATHIVLIPKTSNPESITQFRPISLCNVVYKLASKCVANRLKPLLNQIISPYQSAFVPGRLITDNVLVAFELNHFIKHKTRGNKGFLS